MSLAQRTGVLMAAVAVCAPAAGCAAAARSPAPTPPAAAVRPQHVLDPAPPPSAAASVPACDSRASLRPRGPLPLAGVMPAGSTMARILQRGRLIVGADQDAYMMGYRDTGTGQLAGFDIDIAKQIAKAIFGTPDAVQFLAINAADRIPMIQQGKVDVVVRRLAITCDRLEQVAFSTEYLNSPQRLLVVRGFGYRSMFDLGGRKVCAATGSVNIPVIQRFPSHPVAVAADSISDCLVMLQQDQVQAVSTDEAGLIGLAAQDPKLEIVGDPLDDNPIGVAMKKDATDLVRFINAVLERIRADGTWKALYRRWLGPYSAVPMPPRPRYLD